MSGTEKKQEYYLDYGIEGAGYVVKKISTNEAIFRTDSKSEAIGRAQKLNGWVVDGEERTYAAQTEVALR